LVSTEHSSEAAAAVRLQEAQASANILGAHFHAPFCNDLEIFYDSTTIRRLAAIIRTVKPTVILTHSPADYMEDHTNTCRCAVTAAFSRGMPNYESIPPVAATENYDCTVYHSLPHTLRTSLRKRITPGAYVDTTSIYEQKLAALSAHQSQQSWLDASQNMNSYLQTMEDASLEVGKMSGRFKHAEGWRRHLHHGLCAEDCDPLSDLGEAYLISETYENDLELY
jgi:LmbE family N-acetylglucosaminyl deacetylase